MNSLPDSRRTWLLPVLALLLVAALPAVAEEGAGEAATAPMNWRPLLTSSPIEFATVDPLYRDAARREGGILKVIEELKAYGADAAQPSEKRANALLVASHMQWRYGQRKEAAELVDQALKMEVTADLALQQARLLEASGEVEQAQRWYEQAFELLKDPKRREQVRLRMTFVAVGQQNIEALVRLAQGRDRAFRNRAAVALAVLNYYDEATGLYEVYGEGSERFRQHLRLSQWALEAGHAPGAQEEAWKAVQSAPLDRDRRYALSVLVDAHMLDDSLDKLLTRFEKKGRLTEEEQDVRIDLLQKLGRYEEAIRLFKEGDRSQITAASRRQLLRMYSDAGRTGDMLAEYRKLMAAEPDEVAWPEGLSQHLMEQGEREEAQAMWREFIARNDNVGVLLSAAQTIASFGFDDLALEAADKVLTADERFAAQALLFHFELHMRRGRTAEAGQVLKRMNETLAADAPERVELADAYERIEKPLEALQVLEALDKARPNGLGTDERMRLAWLYDSTGKREEALAVWQSMWDGKTTEAFRRLIENRLVSLAAETGRLGDLAVDLETRLADGTATKKDSALLIRIYTDTNDSASAVEVIREYFRQGDEDRSADVESLREQANVYRALGRYDAYKTLTTRLLQSDPENQVDYLQSLILNQLENGAGGEEKAEELKAWLTQLRATGGGAAGAEFEAGILQLAGMEDQAIATYRRALAENPDHSDNFLLLADLLKKNSREAEAIGALQYLIETADQDDAFIVGVDGILNMRPRDKWIIEWAQRRVLERLTARDDKLYLYDLLAELAEGAGDTKVYLSALENSLAYANSRRSNVLRELISATGEKNAMSVMMGGSAGEADPERNLRYSRRLISLQEELPPEVYTDMGKLFLEMNDPESAADAFNHAIDRTGEPHLVEETGDLFRNQGYNRQAMVQYEKALIADTDNYGVMRKLADVRARQGALADANALYLRAMLGLLRSLPLEIEKTGANGAAPTLDSTVSYAFRENYWSLLAGFLYTLPEESSGQFAAIEQAFAEAMNEAVQSADGQFSKALVYYPRLNTTARMVRDSAQRSGNTVLANEVEQQLLQHFDADKALVAELRPADEAADGVSWLLPSTASAQAALARKQYERAVAIALFNGDQALALTAYRDWARQELQGNDAGGERDAIMMAIMGRRGNIANVVRQAKEKLGTQEFASLCRYVFDLASGREEYQRKFLFANPYMFARGGESLLLSMEKAAGRQFLSSRQLKPLLTGVGPGFDVAYVMNRLSVDDGIEILEREVAGSGERSGGVRMALPAVKALLEQRLSARQGERLLELLKKESQKAMGAGAMGNLNMEMLWGAGLTENLARENAGLLEQFDEFLAEADADTFVPGFLKVDVLLATGRERQALPLLVEVALQRQGAASRRNRAMAALNPFMPPQGNAVAQYIQKYAGAIYPRYGGEVMALAMARQKELGMKPEVFSLLYALHAVDPQMDPASVVHWLEGVAAQEPKNETVLEALLDQYTRLGYADLQLKTLDRLVEVAPRKVEYRKRLYGLWQQLENPENAVKAANGKLAEMAVAVEVDPRARAIQRMARQAGGGGGPVGKATEQIVGIERDGDEEQARMGLRSLWQMLPPSGASRSDLRQLMGGSDGMRVLQYNALFGLGWPGSVRGSSGQSGAATRGTAVPAGAVAATLAAPAGAVRAITLMPAGGSALVATARGAPGGTAANAAGTASILRALTAESPQPDRFDREDKLLDALVKYEFFVDELESQVRTLSAEDIDQHYLLYELLARGYSEHGRLPAELERLGARVQSQQASGKETLLWLELVMLLPREQIQPLLPLVEQVAGSMVGQDGYRQIVLARVFGRGGQDERAADIYSSIVLSSKGGNPMAMFMGRGSSAPTTATSLYVDAQEYLGEVGLNRFTKALLRIAAPDEEVAGSGVYEHFVMWMLERNPQSQPALQEFQSLLNGQTDVANWRQDTVIRASALLAQLGRNAEALDLLAVALRVPERSLPSEEDIFNPRGQNPRQQAIQQYFAALGLQGQGGNMPWQMERQRSVNSPAEAFKPLFPVRADAWAGVQAWTQQACNAVAGWIEQGSAQRELGLQVMALMTLSQHQLGAAVPAQACGQQMAQLLAPYESAPYGTASLVVAVLQRVQAPADAQMLRSLIAGRRVEVNLLAPALQRMSTDDAGTALELAEAALAYTQEAELLSLTRKLAESQGRADLVQRVTDIQKKAADARMAIERGEDAKDSAQLSGVLGEEAGAGSGPGIGETIDLKFTAVDGREVDLAKLKGQVVLVDFWATWCGPCIAELPNVKRVYESYKDQGFTIVGISLDRSNAEQKLIDFVAKNNMPWPHHFDGKWWENEFAVKNGVKAIPAAWLFDQDGKLVTKSARGQKLEDEVQRLLSEHQQTADASGSTPEAGGGGT